MKILKRIQNLDSKVIAKLDPKDRAYYTKELDKIYKKVKKELENLDSLFLDIKRENDGYFDSDLKRAEEADDKLFANLDAFKNYITRFLK